MLFRKIQIFSQIKFTLKHRQNEFKFQIRNKNFESEKFEIWRCLFNLTYVKVLTLSIDGYKIIDAKRS